MSASAPRRVFRFAPSPNGLLHLGHAYSAFLNHDLALACGGCFLLRLEDIDRARCTPELEARLIGDLEWLGLAPAEPPRRQSEHFADYEAALEALRDANLAYPGFMTRGEVRAFASLHEEREGRPWPRDPDGAPIYPGLDRDLSPTERRALEKAGWSVEDLDLVEANEAFAAQALAVGKDMGWGTDKVNVNGGAIAIGHPIGASGARVLTTLLYEMKRRDAKKGLATLCIGGGMGIAMCVER